MDGQFSEQSELKDDAEYQETKRLSREETLRQEFAGTFWRAALIKALHLYTAEFNQKFAGDDSIVQSELRIVANEMYTLPRRISAICVSR